MGLGLYVDADHSCRPRTHSSMNHSLIVTLVPPYGLMRSTIMFSTISEKLVSILGKYGQSK